MRDSSGQERLDQCNAKNYGDTRAWESDVVNSIIPRLDVRLIAEIDVLVMEDIADRMLPLDGAAALASAPLFVVCQYPFDGDCDLSDAS